MDKKSALQVLDSAQEELQGKMKNLVWCDAEQKILSVAVPESYEFSEADAAVRSIPKERLSVLSELACGERKSFLVPPDQADEELKNYLSVCDGLPPNFKCFPSNDTSISAKRTSCAREKQVLFPLPERLSSPRLPSHITSAFTGE